MAKVIVAFELLDNTGESTIRWEQQCPAEGAGAFKMLGRAFELAQRDTGTSFHEALVAFLQGASIQKADILEAFQRAEQR